ncbi:hypothetical protein CEXT_2051 [Caerostris extrusa]|uniref:Secreted protein n=1 Tax=Caerostris extrusa TaxID=172846 RepID=A0AAV4VNF8_CAEEX|nr:hypothetical protein CEXT_2051 [Caerostris extrusa]
MALELLARLFLLPKLLSTSSKSTKFGSALQPPEDTAALRCCTLVQTLRQKNLPLISDHFNPGVKFQKSLRDSRH